MFDILNIDESSVSIIANSPLYIVSMISLICFGILAGYFSLQYGRKIKKAENVIRYIAFAYILLLMMIVDPAYIMLFLFLYLSPNIGIVLLIFIKRPYYIGPALNQLAETEVHLDVGVFRLTHPVTNGEQRNWREKDEDFTPDQFETVEKVRYDEKIYTRRRWVFFDRRGDVAGMVSFQLSVQRMADFQDLFKVECLNASASYFYFVNHALPMKADSIHSNVYENPEPMSFKDWRLMNINGHHVISYVFEDYPGNLKRYLHVAISKNLMMTLEFKGEDNLEVLAEKIDLLVNSLIGNWTLDLDNADLKSEIQTMQVSIDPPQLKRFETLLLTYDDYRVALKQHARDEVEWSVFEQSVLFTSWYDNQRAMLCEEFNQLRKAYIKTELKKIYAMCNS